MNDILIQKKASLERCVEQIRRYYQMPSELHFNEDFMKQDAIAMNLQRACECAIDMANHMIRCRKLGLPRSSRESFDLLWQGGLIDEPTKHLMRGMVGFRNVLVHDYQQVDLSIVTAIVENHLDDLIRFADQIIKTASES